MAYLSDRAFESKEEVIRDDSIDIDHRIIKFVPLAEQIRRVNFIYNFNREIGLVVIAEPKVGQMAFIVQAYHLSMLAEPIEVGWA